MKRWIIDQLLGTYYHNFVTHLLEGEYQRRVYELAEAGTPLTATVLSEQKRQTLENFWGDAVIVDRSEEHMSELQSRGHLVCRLLLEKENTSGCRTNIS